MVPAIEGDRAGRPWVEFWGDWLYRVDVLSARLRSLLGIWVTYIMFIVLTWGGLLLSPCVQWTGLLVVVLTLRPLLLVLGI